MICLCYAMQLDLYIFAYLKLCRTNKVSNIFNNKEVKTFKRKIFNYLSNHVSIKVTSPSSVYLDNRDTEVFYPFSIIRACNITLNNPHLHLSGFLYRLFYKRCLAGSRGAHDIDDINT